MEAIVETARSRGPIALARLESNEKFAWYFEERPPPDTTDAFFLGSFWQLGTCRQITMGGPGPIPWTAIKDYGLHHGLDPDVLDAFIQIIVTLDRAYLVWSAEEMRAEAERIKAKGKG